MKPLLLVYGMKTPERHQKMLDLAKHFDYEIKFVTEDEIHEKVGFLVGLENYESSDTKDVGDVPDIDFVLLHNIPQDEQRELFLYMREHDVSTGNKAILTDTNKDWSLAKLLRENDLEHRVMTVWQNLRRAVSYAGDWQEQNGLDEKLNQAMIEAIPFVQPSEDMDLNKMINAYNQLVAEINRLQTK